jgi:hypothetical protein
MRGVGCSKQVGECCSRITGYLLVYIFSSINTPRLSATLLILERGILNQFI